MSDFVSINDTIPYPPGEWDRPLGNNGAGALENYIQRKKYKDVPYFLLLPQPLDSWYDKNYFGRVDPVQNGIVVKKGGDFGSLLRQVKTTRGDVFVLNFVELAFRELKQHMATAVAAGAVANEGSFYSDVSPSAGFYDYDKDAQDFKEVLRRSYSVRLKKNPVKFKKVVDFKSYVEYLLDFYDTKQAPGPITLSGYTVSPLSTPLMSGMVIDLVPEDFSKDIIKVTKYMKDPNFRYFARAARKYGFYIDRNAPWRLFADPLSVPMLYYINQLFLGTTISVNKDSFFNFYYEKTYRLDLTRLQEDLVYMYNKFVQQNPVIKEDWHDLQSIPSYRRCSTLNPLKTYRQATTVEAVQNMGDIYWLDTYFKFRVKEGDLNFRDYDIRFKKAVEIYKVYGVEKAMRFINNEVKPYLYNSDALRKDLTHVSTRGNIA